MVEVLNDKVGAIISSFNEFVTKLNEVASQPADNDPDNKRGQYFAVIEYKIREIRAWLEQDNGLSAFEVVKTHLKALDAAVNKFRAISEVDITTYTNALKSIE